MLFFTYIVPAKCVPSPPFLNDSNSNKKKHLAVLFFHPPSLSGPSPFFSGACVCASTKKGRFLFVRVCESLRARAVRVRASACFLFLCVSVVKLFFVFLLSLSLRWLGIVFLLTLNFSLAWSQFLSAFVFPVVTPTQLSPRRPFSLCSAWGFSFCCWICVRAAKQHPFPPKKRRLTARHSQLTVKQQGQSRY